MCVMHVRVGDIVVIVISLVRSVPYLLCFVFERVYWGVAECGRLFTVDSIHVPNYGSWAN